MYINRKIINQSFEKVSSKIFKKKCLSSLSQMICVGSVLKAFIFHWLYLQYDR